MKNTLVLFIAFVLTGCSIHIRDGKLVSSMDNELESKPERELGYKNGLYYYFGKPYSGNNYAKYDNGNIKQESKYKNGKKDGEWSWYSNNGQYIRGETWDEGELVKTREKL
jgi:antitoxin component YwqK of YwqJK toxin-antitoxin module